MTAERFKYKLCIRVVGGQEPTPIWHCMTAMLLLGLYVSHNIRLNHFRGGGSRTLPRMTQSSSRALALSAGSFSGFIENRMANCAAKSV